MNILQILNSPLVLALIPVVPNLVASLIAIWHTQGKVTDQEIADYLAAQWLDPESVFHKPAATKPPLA